MRIYANQLKANLGKGLKPVYLVFGDEPLQKLESMQAIRDAARQQGFEERISLVADAQFDWNELFGEFNSLSLFSSRKIIELEIDKGKAGQAGAKALTELAGLFNPDTILLIHGSKIEGSAAKSKWFKTLDGLGLYVPVYPIEGDNFNRWLSQRCRDAQIMLDNQGINLLSEFFAGNLLAAAQEIEKLSVSFRGQQVSTDYLQGILLNQSRFNVFQLVDELLLGNIEKALSVLVSLQREGLEPNIVNWALSREVLQLVEMRGLMDAGMSQSDVMSQFKVWKNRQSIVGSALQRLNMAQLNTMVDCLNTLDIKLKSNAGGQPYTDFCHIAMLFAYEPQLRDFQLSA